MMVNIVIFFYMFFHCEDMSYSFNQILTKWHQENLEYFAFLNSSLMYLSKVVIVEVQLLDEDAEGTLCTKHMGIVTFKFSPIV